MSARHSFGRDGGGSARMRPLRTLAQFGCGFAALRACLMGLQQIGAIGKAVKIVIQH
jgi:hypothetical protein